MRIAFLVKELGLSQLSFYLVKRINEYLRENSDFAPIILYENMVCPTFLPMCSLTHFAELACYNGNAIATSMSTAIKMSKTPGPKRKLFYIWDFEYIRPNAQFRYSDIREIGRAHV